MKLGEIDEGTGAKSAPNFTTSDHVVLGADIDSHGRCIIIIKRKGRNT